MRQKFFTSAMAMVMLAAVATPVFSQSQGAGAKLAKETVQLLSTQEMMLVTAVRQKNSRGGTEDFKRFIMQPLESMADRWRALPMPTWGGDQVCLYDGRHYSPGALAIMGRVEMVCTTDSGAPRWSRSEPTALDEGEH